MNDLNARIVAYVQAHPSASTLDIVRNIVGRRQTILATLKELARAGALTPQDGARGSRHWVAAANAPQRLGTSSSATPATHAGRLARKEPQRGLLKKKSEPCIGSLPVSEYVEQHGPDTHPDEIRRKIEWFVGHALTRDAIDRLAARTKELYEASAAFVEPAALRTAPKQEEPKRLTGHGRVEQLLAERRARREAMPLEVT